MKLYRHYVASFAILITLLGLYSVAYAGFSEYYGYGNGYSGENGTTTVDERIQDLTLLNALDNFQKGIFKITKPDNVFDLAGGLLQASWGVVGSLFGIVALPLQLLQAITNFYFIPRFVINGISLLVVIYAAFIFISFKGRGEL